MLALTLATISTAAAVIMRTPEPFEIVSDDGSKVFVFIPSENFSAKAYIAVYEIVDNERWLIYTVEDLPSRSYEWNFYFSADLMHFVHRIHPGYVRGSERDAFEIFSYGDRTRVVRRREFIRDHASTWGTISGSWPAYTVWWEVVDHSDTTITIRTDEGRTVTVDMATARLSLGGRLLLPLPSARTARIALAVMIAGGTLLPKLKKRRIKTKENVD